MRELVVGPNDSGQRLDKFLAKTFRTMPASLLYKYIRKKCVTVNRKKVTESCILQEGDVLSLYIRDEFFERPPEKEAFRRLLGETSSLRIAYEDENLLVADKPAGLLVHSDREEQVYTLIHLIQAYLYEKGEYRPETENAFAPSLCNRIDRNTEGLVIAAKNARALAEMNEMIKRRQVEKTYLAVVHGLFALPSGELRGRLEKNEKTNTVRVSSRHGKEAVTRYRVLRVNRERRLSLLEVSLLTGRTHQIRVQFADAGHPLLGDGKYAVNKADRQAGFTHQALCAHSLRFCPEKADFSLLGYLRGVEVRAKEPAFLSLFR